MKQERQLSGWQISAATACGPRPENQDRALLCAAGAEEILLDGEDTCTAAVSCGPAEDIVCAVADGVGSCPQSGPAAQQALTLLLQQAAALPEKGAAVLEEINQQITEAFFDGRKGRSRGACTLSLLAVQGNVVQCYNVGDSPVYHVPAETGQLTPLYTPQTQAALGNWPDPPEWAKHTLVNYIGNPFFEDYGPQVSEPVCACPGDVFLVASDGLAEALGTAALAKLLHDPQTTAESLLLQAEEAGTGKDNMTAVVLRAV